MIRANQNEVLGTRPDQQVEVVDTSAKPKTEYVCVCGARRFKWVATHGMIKPGGFKPDEYIYECLGCGKKVEEKQIKAFFR